MHWRVQELFCDAAVATSHRYVAAAPALPNALKSISVVI